MKDYSSLIKMECHIEHVETMEEASAFCKAYGDALGKYAQDKEQEMEESGELRESKDLLIVLIVFGVALFIIRLSSEFETLVGAAVFMGLMNGVIIPSICRCLGKINYSNNIKSRANGFIELYELKGLTDERALDYTNNLVDRYNRMVDDDDRTIADVYNCNFKKNPEKGANIAIIAMGILIFLIILFCVINELNVF